MAKLFHLPTFVSFKQSNRPVAGSFAVLFFAQKNRFLASATGKRTRIGSSFRWKTFPSETIMLLLESNGPLVGKKCQRLSVRRHLGVEAYR